VDFATNICILSLEQCVGVDATLSLCFSTVSAHTRTPREDFWLKSSQLQTRQRDVCCSAICIKILVTGQANIFNLQAKHDFLAAAHSHKWKWKEFLLSGVYVHSLARSPPAPYYFRPVSLALTLNLSRMLALHVRQLTFIRERQPLQPTKAKTRLFERSISFSGIGYLFLRLCSETVINKDRAL
jgi:hypothetical protein